MDSVSLENAVKDMDRRKFQDGVDFAAKSGLDAAASIGTETPMVLLRDIRRCLLDLTDIMRENQQLQRERDMELQTQHQEVIATLQQISIQASVASPASYRPSLRTSIGSQSATGEKRKFFHESITITTGAQIVGLVLLHLDAVLKNSAQLATMDFKDALIIELKDWSSCIIKLAAVESVITNRKHKLELPKPTQQETITALEKVASVEYGRQATFRLTELVLLQQSCPGLMAIVEEVRLRLMKCPGIFPEGKRKKLSYFRYPYVTREDDLNVAMSPKDFITSGPVVLESVPKLKDNGKKAYVLEVLGKGTAPIIAYNKAKDIS